MPRSQSRCPSNSPSSLLALAAAAPFTLGLLSRCLRVRMLFFKSPRRNLLLSLLWAILQTPPRAEPVPPAASSRPLSCAVGSRRLYPIPSINTFSTYTSQKAQLAGNGWTRSLSAVRTTLSAERACSGTRRSRMAPHFTSDALVLPPLPASAFSSFQRFQRSQSPSSPVSPLPPPSFTLLLSTFLSSYTAALLSSLFETSPSIHDSSVSTWKRGALSRDGLRVRKAD